ncbi:MULTISPECIES: hypothetical protein [unclassified Streptomyces]|uniref:hypothetical protein n=1 Tax=unclassified Streptomyces TaxID=2593676 RepID=UPI003D72EC97
MSPEITVAMITAASVIVAAVVAAVPAFLSLQRRTAGAVATEGVATRDAVATAMASLGSRLDARIDDVRDDIDGVREDVARVREWQAGHDAEHLLIGRQEPRGDA